MSDAMAIRSAFKRRMASAIALKKLVGVLVLVLLIKHSA
jgi:hypothetical protein